MLPQRPPISKLERKSNSCTLFTLSAFVAMAILLPRSAAASSSDADFRVLTKDRKFDAAEILARERFSKDSKDDVALWYWARLAGGDAKKREELIPKVEQCVVELPQSAKCHHALGTLYGAAALSSGIMNGLKYASRIRDSFAKAVELDPRSFEARNDLNQFYLQAPGLAGGSVRKALENAAAHEKLNAFEGKLLRIQVHVYEKEFDKAEALLASLQAPAGNDSATTALSQSWAALGFAMLNDKQVRQAQGLFERRLAVDMDNAMFHFGLGRAHLENNAFDSAIASLERALRIDAKLTAHYRLGIAYQGRGDKARAIAAFQQFLTYATTGKAAEDARARLDALKKV